MRRLKFLQEAIDDLVAISDYLAQASGSRSVAISDTARLRQRCRRLSTLPGTLGRARPDIQRDLRSVVEGSHLILFRYEADRVEIIRVIEGHRDIQAQFPAPSDPSSQA